VSVQANDGLIQTDSRTGVILQLAREMIGRFNHRRSKGLNPSLERQEVGQDSAAIQRPLGGSKDYAPSELFGFQLVEALSTLDQLS
jgi:hypothetical protein